jgi:AcrR family transcriptional regulator
LGDERTELQARREKITEDAVELMSDAERDGVSIARLADLIQIDRPTLYRLRNAIAIHRANRAERGKEGGV